jgi:hypothetical protein
LIRLRTPSDHNSVLAHDAADNTYASADSLARYAVAFMAAPERSAIPRSPDGASPIRRHALFKPEHPAIVRQVGLFWAIRIGVAGVVVLNNVEATDVDVEVDVALLEVGRVG